METGKEFLLAVREGTESAFEEYSEDAGDYLDKLCDYISQACNARGLQPPRRDRIIYFEGMLRGVQLQFRKKKIELEKIAHEQGIDLKGIKQ